MQKPEIVVIGHGGHARVVASLAGTASVMSDAAFFAAPPDPQNIQVIVGIGDNALRETIFNRVLQLGFEMGTCIAPLTFVAQDAKIGIGSVICAGAVIGTGAVIGRNTIVNTLSSVDHDCTLGDHSQITAGVILGGASKIGQRCFLGIQSGVLPGVRIGDNSIVMAGALVTADVESGVMVGGSPARVMRRNP